MFVVYVIKHRMIFSLRTASPASTPFAVVAFKAGYREQAVSVQHVSIKATSNKTHI